MKSTIIINYYNQINWDFNKNKVKNEILKILSKKCDGCFELGIHFINASKIKKLNQQYRKINKTTDVLSFPTNEKITNILPINNLGDIFVCPSYASKKLEERFNKDWLDLTKKEQKKLNDNEIIFLIIHGLKHLIGIHHKE